eukprot:TRINITY_DN6962_c0_g1_i1.p1 TRINITY_DN6962_c0_g1~~TRINITY_DN6962_c0_g1_i1.p1  ORF type:complete len:276 (-),score=44.85 TRINITY_DN6962_c0_g1_i1:155-952(-)
MTQKPPEPDSIIPFFRITVLGDADVGKTCLINSWVNNYCPTVYSPTCDPTLYYRTVRNANPMAEDELVTILVEIEDTYPPSKTGGVDMYGTRCDVANFMDVTPQPPEPVSVVTPNYVAPMGEFHALSELEYQPLSRCRMGFMLVYDANVEESLHTAMELYKTLHEDKGGRGRGITIFLVANKIDKDPMNVQTQNNIAAGRSFAEIKEIKHMEVSALKYIHVRKLFREMVEQITMQPQLWASDAMKEFQEKRTKGKGPGGEQCGVM